MCWAYSPLYDARHLFFLKNKLLDKKYLPFILASYRVITYLVSKNLSLSQT